MGEVSTIGVDIAKSAFQVHGVDADGVNRPSNCGFVSSCFLMSSLGSWSFPRSSSAS